MLSTNSHVFLHNPAFMNNYINVPGTKNCGQSGGQPQPQPQPQPTSAPLTSIFLQICSLYSKHLVQTNWSRSKDCLTKKLTRFKSYLNEKQNN